MINSCLPPIHPGEFLAETLHELGFSQAQFARAIGVSPMRVSHVVNRTRPVTAELNSCSVETEGFEAKLGVRNSWFPRNMSLALLFGRALGQSPQYWLNLQGAYDLKLAEVAISQQLLNVAELVPG